MINNLQDDSPSFWRSAHRGRIMCNNLQKVILVFGIIFGTSSFAFSQGQTETERRGAERKMICLIRIICNDFRDATNACAVAGDFNRCVQIKMRGEDASKMCDLRGNVKSEVIKDFRNQDYFEQGFWSACWDVAAEVKAIEYGVNPSYFKTFEGWLKDLSSK
jgi:hypothetical protein